MAEDQRRGLPRRNLGERLDVWGRFILSTSLIVTLVLLSIFIGIFIRNKELIHKAIETQARSHFQNIVLTRRWSAGYGGVYVEKTAGVHSNPYLENPDIHTGDGKTYTLKNPALMTREVSELASQSRLFTFHITSLEPLNPGNAPDDFERQALLSFETGEPERMEYLDQGGRVLFRYMAPLMTEPGCLKCHAKQGYREGQVRGGISVALDVTPIQSSLSYSNAVIALLCGLTILVMLGLLNFFILNLMRRLKTAQAQLQAMATSDSLTGLFNRGVFMTKLGEELERAKRYDLPLSLIMLDLDHFKRVNDEHGHQTGDLVLRTVADLVRANLRQTDFAARYGGEEIIALLPQTDLERARQTAEKLRRAVEGHAFPTDRGKTVQVTASLGCSALSAGRAETSAEALINAADEALYQAKSAGRNRVA